jgi:hypothetical protein
MKRLIRKILREEIEKSDRHYRMLDKISDHVQLPYFKSMEGLTIDDKDDQLYIMRKILGVDIGYTFEIGDKNFNVIYDDDGYDIYKERLDGYWYKYEYDEHGNQIYIEESNGDWVKSEYDDNNNWVYEEHSDGYIWDER